MTADEKTADRRRKRSSTLTLTTVMATAGITLSACDQPGPTAANKPVEAVAYANLDQCKAADEVPDAECDKAYAKARADDENAPKYAERASCEDVYGAGNCVPRGSGGGWFVPAMTGFVIGRMLDGGRPYYTGTGLYRERDDGYVTGYGGRLGRDYSSGRTVIQRGGLDPDLAVRSTPGKVQSRTAAVSRGGFGGRSSGMHFGG